MDITLQQVEEEQQINSDELVFETIRANIQTLSSNSKTQTQTSSKRNLLNKWFLDSIKSYFMEQHAAPLLNSYLSCNTSQEVREYVHSRIDPSLPKYMSILSIYVELLSKFNRLADFKSRLLKLMTQSVREKIVTSTKDYQTEKLMRKQFVSLLIVVYCDYYHVERIQSFYDLWNITFPNDKQFKKRLSRYDVKALNRKTEENNNISSFSSHNEIEQQYDSSSMKADQSAQIDTQIQDSDNFFMHSTCVNYSEILPEFDESLLNTQSCSFLLNESYNSEQKMEEFQYLSEEQYDFNQEEYSYELQSSALSYVPSFLQVYGNSPLFKPAYSSSSLQAYSNSFLFNEIM